MFPTAAELPRDLNVRLHSSWLGEVQMPAHHDSDGFGTYKLAVEGRKITGLAAAGGTAALARIAMPCPIDCHTHIDKGHIWSRSPNVDGTFTGALDSVATDRSANWSADDVEARMEFSLKCAYAHGTKAVRTHIDSLAPQENISWPVFQSVRDRWKGKIVLQAACLFAVDQVDNEVWFERLVRLVKASGGVLGCVTYMVPDLDALLDRIFRAAIDHGLELDFHADETDDLEAKSLHHIAKAAQRNGYDGRILVGHCCSLARQPDDVVKATLDDVAASDISVVSLPMCNMYLQDRRSDGTTPRWRGVTLLHEMKARGINVCVASDNTRDPFYAYGDLDMLEVYRQATRTCHFDHPVADWPRALLANPAAAMGLDGSYGRIGLGDPADFLVFEGRTWTELLSRPESNRILVRDGKIIERILPTYDELDHLMEQTTDVQPGRVA
ncbi:MAG: cytosine deaminase [Pseudomonadota bacterium]